MRGNDITSVRIDIWLWAVRAFKTRSLAAAACKNSQVFVSERECKPSRQVRVGDHIVFTKGVLTQTFVVKALLEKRVGAKLVSEFREDATPDEMYRKAHDYAQNRRMQVAEREKGTGRPSKKERRDLDEFIQEVGGEEMDFDDFLKAIRKQQGH